MRVVMDSGCSISDMCIGYKCNIVICKILRMNHLVELAHNIQRYNLKGSVRLAPIKLAILYKKIHQPIVDNIINDMRCEKTNTSF